MMIQINPGRYRVATQEELNQLRQGTKEELSQLRQSTDKQLELPVSDFRRHLLFHLYPRRDSNWRWHCLKLLEYAPLFNGKKIVALVLDGTTDVIGYVRDALQDVGCEIIEIPNDPNLREVRTFEALFSQVSEDIGLEDVTLYAHGKGTTNHTWPDKGKTIQLWTETLYEAMCSYWPYVAKLLVKKPIAGCFLRRGNYWANSRSNWHYSGSWFWFRNKDLFSRNWRNVERFWSGIETYPSTQFLIDNAAVVFGDMHIPGEASWPYKSEVWQNVLIPMLERWREEHKSDRWSVERKDD